MGAGWVMSDWTATHSTASITDGLDQEMPSGVHFGVALTAAVHSGEVSEAFVNESVVRILTQYYIAGLMDTPNPNTGTVAV